MDLLNEYLGSVPTPPPADMEIKCDRLLRDIDGPDVAQARLTEACEMVRAHPDRELPQTTAAQLLELTRRNDDMLDTWSALYQRFPGNALAMRMSLRWMARSGRAEEGKAVVAST